jgi:hypothetical protein
VRTDALRVAFAGDEVLSGPLHARVKAEAATWYIGARSKRGQSAVKLCL